VGESTRIGHSHLNGAAWRKVADLTDTSKPTSSPKGSSLKGPTLRIVSAEGETIVPLIEPELALGRSTANSVCIDSEVVSSVHARLIREGGTYRFHQIGSTNPTLLDGVPVDDYALRHGDRLQIAPGTPHAITLVFEAPQQVFTGDLSLTRSFTLPGAGAQLSVARLDLPLAGELTVGRSPASDLVLPSLSVSRLHARLQIDDGVVSIADAGSANGTYVNGARVEKHQLVIGDIVRIGPYKLVYRRDAIEHQDDSRAVRLDAYEVTRFIGRKQILQAVSFCALPGEVVAIAGTSGAGKSTLLHTLNGMRPPATGRVLVNGADLHQAYDALRPLIGYVPQEHILPAQLTVRRALQYVARLRLPRDVASQSADERVDEVMRVLDLFERRDVRLDRLSGGERKRASIAAELISSPGLFFLDEPTSGLDPGLARRVTEIVRELALANSTVVVVSHDVESLQAVDKIVFLASGGRLVFIGTPSEALEYFAVDDLADIYRRVESEDSAVWQERFKESEQYRERVAPGLVPAQAEESKHSARVSWDPVALFSAGTRRSSSAWRQFQITVTRYAETMLRDRGYLSILLIGAPLIALFLAIIKKSTDFQPPSDATIALAATVGFSAAQVAATNTLPVFLAAIATWFGAFNSAREIVKEKPIFLRDKLSGMRILPYLSSKVLVLAVLCMIQTLVLLAIVTLKVDLPSSGALMWGPLELWITLFLASFAAMGMGLLISATMDNADRAASLVPLVMIPQFLFVAGSGGGPGQWLSYLTVTHWSSEALKITAHIPYKVAGGFAGTDLVLHWIVLIGMAAVFVGLTAWRLSRRQPT
jgi:ABC-type multidrug transport system ATPase subunit/pSer/pThr/pTyr-binding forkhead associated (FHA) protein